MQIVIACPSLCNFLDWPHALNKASHLQDEVQKRLPEIKTKGYNDAVDKKIFLLGYFMGRSDF